MDYAAHDFQIWGVTSPLDQCQKDRHVVDEPHSASPAVQSCARLVPTGRRPPVVDLRESLPGGARMIHPDYAKTPGALPWTLKAASDAPTNRRQGGGKMKN